MSLVALFVFIAEAESALILIRHGESLWNEKNLFSGCCSVPLTNRGVEEAIEAGQRISYIPIDMIFTSALIRAQMTAMLAMTQHSQKKVVLPLIIVFSSYLIENDYVCTSSGGFSHLVLPFVFCSFSLCFK